MIAVPNPRTSPTPAAGAEYGEDTPAEIYQDGGQATPGDRQSLGPAAAVRLDVC